jgi:L-lactate dehydrogenase complex protein LldG
MESQPIEGTGFPKMTPSSNKSRESILHRLRSSRIEAPQLPDVIHGDWLRFADPIEQLKTCIQSVGGSCESHPNLPSVRERLNSFPEIQQSTRILSTLPGFESHVNLDQIEDPRQLADIDFVITAGQFAVAENGAVWVDDQAIKHRAIFFITQHLILLVKQSAVVHNMHEAYSRIDPTPKAFGCFISGPSKTADIEQSLVIGAHGCRSMQLYVVDSW